MGNKAIALILIIGIGAVSGFYFLGKHSAATGGRSASVLGASVNAPHNAIGVWIVPVGARPKAKVTLSADVKSPNGKKGPVTVIFSADGKVLGKTSVIAPTKGMATASLPWEMPISPTDVQITVTGANGTTQAVSAVIGPGAAVSASGSTLISSLLAPKVISVTVPSLNPQNSPAIELAANKVFDAVTSAQESTVVSSVSTTFNRIISEKIEPFRVAQSQAFAASADAARTRISAELGKKVGDEVEKKVSSALDPGRSVAGDAATATKAATVATTSAFASPLEYATLIGTMAISSFFANKTVFYISLVLLLLLVLRMLVSIFSKDS